MVDEFQDTNRLQLRPAGGARARQPVRGRRRVPVDLPLPPRRRGDLPRAPRARSAARPRARAGGQLPLRARSCSTCSTPPSRPSSASASRRWWPAARRAGARRRRGELRLFDPDPPAGEPPVELLVTDTAAGTSARPRSASPRSPSSRGAAPRRALVAHRLREEVDAGRRPGDIVVLVRADRVAAAVRAGARGRRACRRYVVGGRGYWSQEQVRDALAYLAALANPRDEAALLRRARLAVLRRRAPTRWSLLAGAGREPARRGRVGRAARAAAARRGSAGWAPPLAARRARAAARASRASSPPSARGRSGSPVEALLERAIAAHGLRPRVLARAGRRAAAGQPAQADAARARLRARRGARPARLPRLRRHAGPRRGARGRGAARVRRARRRAADDDPPRQGARVPGRRASPTSGAHGAGGRPRLLLGARRRRVGPAARARWAAATRVRRSPTSALAAEEDRAEAEEERRLLYVAMTRAPERLILSGGADCERWPSRARAARRWTGSCARWPATPSAPFARRRRRAVVERAWDGRAGARALPGSTRPPRRRRRAEARARAAGARAAARRPPRCRTRRRSCRRRRRGRGPAPLRLSYSRAQALRPCGYRFYLERVLRPARREAPPPLPAPSATPTADGGSTRATRGSLVHALLETLDFAAPGAAAGRGGRARWRRARRRARRADDVEDFAALRGRVRRARRCARACAAARAACAARRGFAFALEPGGGGSLVNGFVDVLAAEADGGALIVDYKTDRLDGADPGRASSSATTRPAAASTRSPRCAPARRASRSRTASSSGPTSRRSRAYAPADARRAGRASVARLAARRARRALPRHRAPASRAVRDLPGPRRPVLVSPSDGRPALRSPAAGPPSRCAGRRPTRQRSACAVGDGCGDVDDLAAVATRAWARSSSNAARSSRPWRSIRMPFARSITRPALERVSRAARPAR